MDELSPKGTEDLLGRLQIEKAKLEIEDLKLRVKQMNRPWFLRIWFLKSLGAGLVLVPLLWFYIVQVAIPLFQANQHRLNREFQYTLDSLDRVKKENLEFLRLNRIALDSLKEVKSALGSMAEENKRTSESLGRARNDLARSTQEFKIGQHLRTEEWTKRYNNLSDAFQNLSNQNSLTEKEREEYRQKYQNIQEELAAQKQAAKTSKPTSFYEEVAARRNTLIVFPSFPNPFHDSTSIAYFLQEGATTSARIIRYDQDEKKEIEVKRLIIKDNSKGPHSVVWDGSDNDGRSLPAGRYYCIFMKPFAYKEASDIRIVIDKSE
ncbi:MAG TPA: hypothetical protein DGH68_06090 [Bacteroidetes bacterium]|jgi:hypothetical protein|nr:hypothetical protein [Bacteroidota bacterium]